MRTLEISTQFKKDFKKIAKLPIPDLLEVGHIISLLQMDEPLAARHVDHALTGNWHGFRDCHIKPDLVPIYRLDGSRLQLARIGSHSDLF